MNKTVKFLSLVIAFTAIISTCFYSGANRTAAFASGGVKSSSIVIESTTKRILSSQNHNARLPMASTTKIMTALVVLENAKLDETVEINSSAVGVEGSSIYLRNGEKLTVRELLYGLMLRSGNDSAVALAIYVGGSVSGFVRLMNEKAEYLGLKNTNFTNPHGLHDGEHYTSAYDLAIISAEAMRNPEFAKIVSTKSVYIGENESRRYLVNKNKILSGYEGGNGIKTGYTKNAGRCLVSASLRNGMQIICVVLNHPDMWQDSVNLMNEAHSAYKMVKLLDINYEISEQNVVAGVKKTCVVKLARDVYYPLREDEIRNLTYETVINKELVAPVKSGEECGFVNVSLENHLLFSEKIYIMENIDKKSIFDWSYWQIYENQ